METFIVENWSTLLSVALIIISNVITFVVHNKSSKRLTTLETGTDTTDTEKYLLLIMDTLTQVKEVLNEKDNQSQG